MITSLQIERYYPYIGGLIAGAAVIVVARTGWRLSYSENMLASLVSLGGIFAGFLATVKTLLLTMDRAVLARLKSTGYVADLLRYLKEGIYGSLVLCVVAMLGFNTAMRWPVYHAALLFAALIFSLLALYRISRIAMALLVSDDGEPDDKTPTEPPAPLG